MHVGCKSRELFSFCTSLEVEPHLRALQKLSILPCGPATMKPPVLGLCWHRGCGCVSAPGALSTLDPSWGSAGGGEIAGVRAGSCRLFSLSLTQHRGWKPSRSLRSRAIMLTARSAHSFPAFSSQPLPFLGTAVGLTGVRIPWTCLCIPTLTDITHKCRICSGVFGTNFIY